MTSPNPGIKTVRSERITELENLITMLADARAKKKGRGSVEVGELKVAYSSMEQLEKYISKYTHQLKLLQRPQSIRI